MDDGENSGSTRSGVLRAGTPPPDIADLARVEDRLSFLYFEHCRINRDSNAITVHDENGITHIPSAVLGVLMLGPGTSITHDAMTVISDSGSTVVWVGERGVRMYASGKPLTHSSGLLQRQAELTVNKRSRIAVARLMYQMRFPHEDVSSLTMQQLRGREGSRIRRIYREWSRATGVKWDKREYDPDSYESSSEINKALSAAHACLYGLSHAVIVSLGCSPGLGFVHFGHENSFVYDIADLYKGELSIPVAFKIASLNPADIGAATRRSMRDAFFDGSVLSRMARDIKALLAVDPKERGLYDGDRLALWDERLGEVPSGRCYSEGDQE